jgi:phage terminase small subunit
VQVTAMVDGDDLGGGAASGDAGLGGAGDGATGPTPAPRAKRATPSQHPKSERGGPQVPTATPTHTQNPISIPQTPLLEKNHVTDLAPPPSDEEIDAWLLSVGSPLEDFREERFCHEYIQDYSAKKALARAGYSEAWSAINAAKYVRRPHINKRIQEIQGAVCRNLDVTAERVAQELASVGFSRMSDFIEITPGGKLNVKEFHNLRDDQIAALDEIKIDAETGAITSVKVHPKMPALDMLGKHLRMWDKDDNKKRGTTFNLNVTIGSDGKPSAPVIEGTSEDVPDGQS